MVRVAFAQYVFEVLTQVSVAIAFLVLVDSASATAVVSLAVSLTFLTVKTLRVALAVLTPDLAALRGTVGSLARAGQSTFLALEHRSERGESAAALRQQLSRSQAEVAALREHLARSRAECELLRARLHGQQRGASPLPDEDAGEGPPGGAAAPDWAAARRKQQERALFASADALPARLSKGGAGSAFSRLEPLDEPSDEAERAWLSGRTESCSSTSGRREADGSRSSLLAACELSTRGERSPAPRESGPGTRPSFTVKSMCVGI